MPSDQFVPVTVPLYYEGHAYRAGSRIRVRVSAPNGDQPIWSFSETEPAGTAEVEIGYGDGMPSRLVLPQVPGVDVPDQLPPCPGLRGEPCRDYVPFENDTSVLDGYPRPKSATPTYVPMVVAYGACGSATKVHAAPLALGFLHGPAGLEPAHGGNARRKQRAGQRRRLGAPQGDPRRHRHAGRRVRPVDRRKRRGRAQEVRPVRLRGRAAPVLGGARDRQAQQPRPDAQWPRGGDLKDVTFGPSVPCTPTDDPASTVVGSTCAVSTTVNSLIPGLIVGGARAIWAARSGQPERRRAGLRRRHRRRQHAVHAAGSLRALSFLAPSAWLTIKGGLSL